MDRIEDMASVESGKSSEQILPKSTVDVAEKRKKLFVSVMLDCRAATARTPGAGSDR